MKTSPIKHPDRFYIDGRWVEPSSSSRFQVLNSATWQLFATVAEAQEADVNRASGSITADGGTVAFEGRKIERMAARPGAPVWTEEQIFQLFPDLERFKNSKGCYLNV